MELSRTKMIKNKKSGKEVYCSRSSY